MKAAYYRFMLRWWQREMVKRELRKREADCDWWNARNACYWYESKLAKSPTPTASGVKK